MKRPRVTTRSLIVDLGQRPALNGGWEKLAKQQEQQCKDLRIARRRGKQMGERLGSVEMWIAKWDSRWKWLIGLLGTIATGVVAKAVVDIFLHR